MNQEKIKDEPETPKVLDISDGDDDNEQDSFAQNQEKIKDKPKGLIN